MRGRPWHSDRDERKEGRPRSGNGRTAHSCRAPANTNTGHIAGNAAANDAVDVGGGTVSDALDAVTNYLDPGLNVNAWVEVTDGDADYHFQVYFNLDPETEPAPPLVINELADPTR